LLKALQDNIVKYEKKHGQVAENQQNPFANMNFTPKAQA